MKRNSSLLTPLDWARRVNRSWLVRGNLNEDAEVWLEHLGSLDDGRLLRSCENARAMCSLRQPLDDPKPWFYAGLFSLAAAAEARRYLATHRITKAIVPAMQDDEDVILWVNSVGPDTIELLDRLRHGIAGLRHSPDG